jgi:hypothetical protein
MLWLNFFHVYGDSYRNASSWQQLVKHFTDGKRDITDQPHSSQLKNDIMGCHEQKFYMLITED